MSIYVFEVKKEKLISPFLVEYIDVEIQNRLSVPTELYVGGTRTDELLFHFVHDLDPVNGASTIPNLPLHEQSYYLWFITNHDPPDLLMIKIMLKNKDGTVIHLFSEHQCTQWSSLYWI